MSKIAVVYWSGTGNTEAMANAIADGARNAGAAVEMFTADGDHVIIYSRRKVVLRFFFILKIL